MSNAVLEINDHAVSLYHGSGLVATSPGFVLAHGKQLQFGQQALAQSRLHPVSSNNEFWYRLGMAPLVRPLANFRHYADIAHGHLMHLAQESEYEGEVVVAVPASFNREQLAVLSGILQHTPFRAQAVMDAALMASSQLPENSALVYVDLQLHQLSFTRLISEAGHVRRDAFTVVPGAGWVALSNALVQVVNDAFIAQSRFNPQHSAAWEQQLYNELPQWLQQFHSGQQEILVEIDTGKSTAQARVGVSEMLEALQPAFQKISQHFAQFVAHAAVPAVLSARADQIPGLAFCLKAVPLLLTPEQLADMGARARPSSGAANGVSYISSVARAEHIDRSAETAPDAAAGPGHVVMPTHVLYQSQAWALPLSVSLINKTLQFSSGQVQQKGEMFSIVSDGRAAVLHAAGVDIAVAGTTVKGSVELVAGDVIHIRSLATDVQLIRVHM